MIAIEPYTPERREAVLELSLRAWADVLPRTREAVPRFVFDAFYPEGWKVRQHADLAAVLDGEPQGVDVATDGAAVVGWVCTRLHPGDRMGEVHVLAAPARRPLLQGAGAGQRQPSSGARWVSTASTTWAL